MTLPISPTPISPTQIQIERFFALEATSHAVHWCATVQVAIWAAGPNSGYGLKLDTATSPRIIPHLTFRVKRGCR